MAELWREDKDIMETHKNSGKLVAGETPVQQGPDADKLNKGGRPGYRETSIGFKVASILAIALLFFGAFCAYISFSLYKDTSIEQHKKLGLSISNLVASVIDGNRIDEYIRKGDLSQGYVETKRQLQIIKHSSPHIDFVYVYKIMPDGCHVVFDLDTEEVKASEPGEVIPFEDAFKPYLPTLLAGGRIDPIVSDDSFGWLLTVYTPVFDDDGKCQAYAGVDISMNELREDARTFLFRLSVIFGAIFLITLVFAVMLARNKMVSPINAMAKVTGAFTYKNEEDMERNLEEIRRLDIRTGDEIENLYFTFVQMTKDSVKHMTDIQKKNETIMKMHDALLVTLADMVENRDENTGQHIRKTAAYTRIIMDELKREGVYLDQLTDKFIADVYKAAPLHDVGKISVSDVILNKPGKLTDEEFEIMKTHAVEGGKIISTLMEKVPDADYLYEAKNLATYHHEKWNGKGYPEGLAGENIPLSARIMAVADVFDALVSNRCYKKGFPYDKALNIIREESGTHFDPKVVEAFLAVKKEATEIADAFFATDNDVLQVLNDIAKNDK